MMTAALKIQKYLMDAPSILVAWLQPKLAAVSSNPWNECVAPTLSALQLKNLRGTTLGASSSIVAAWQMARIIDIIRT